MLPLKVKTQVVFLEGLSLRGTFQIFNPNPKLAIIYQVQSFTIDSQSHKPASNSQVRIEFFPKSGILLKECSEKITVKARNADSFEEMENVVTKFKIKIKYHFDNNYNRVLIKNGESLLSKHGEQILPFRIGSSYHQIKDKIQSEVMLNSTLGKETINISKISIQDENKHNQDEEDLKQFGTIINSLSLVSKIDEERSEEMADESEVGKWQSIGSLSHFQNEESIQIENNGNQKGAEKRAKKKEINSFQLILLTLLAAFFFSLGSNLKILTLA